MTLTKAPPTGVPEPVPEPARRPAPQGHSSHMPAAVLERLAESTGTPIVELGQVTVASSAEELWYAVTTYLALSPVPPGRPSVPLIVKHCRYDIDDDVVPDESDNGSDDGLFGAPSTRPSQRHSHPVFTLAPGAVEFVWPPPAHLSADTLLEKMKNNPSGDLLSLQELGEARSSADGTDGDSVEREVIHLFHYRVGEPKATFRELLMLSEMLLVSPGGTRPLTRFCAEVMAWSQKINKPKDLCSRFPLSRFKIECEQGRWASEGLKRSRPADSVILSGTQMETILADIDNFRSSATRSWYFRHGLPYRRSYLFYGPPGTGKTSTVRVIASRFELTCCSLSMANNKFSNQALGDALSSMPKNALLVLEDVDALFNEDRMSMQDNALTFSGLLNALDGLVSVEGLITVMTTNHIERLERALIRGGRVDRRFMFELPGETELAKLFRSFYPEAENDTREQFVRTVMARREGAEARAVSTLQQLFIEMREKSAEECVSGIDAFFESHFPAQGSANGAVTDSAEE